MFTNPNEVRHASVQMQAYMKLRWATETAN